MSDPAPLLAQLRELRPTRVFTLAPRRTLERGAAYMAQGRVDAFSWKDGILEARVNGESRYVVRIMSEGPQLRATCTCPAFERVAEPCKHAVAALMAASHALNGSRYTLHPPRSSAVKAWLRALETVDQANGAPTSNPPANVGPGPGAMTVQTAGGAPADKVVRKKPLLEIVVDPGGSVAMQALTAAGKPLRWWDAPTALRMFLHGDHPDPALIEDYFEIVTQYLDIVVVHGGVRHSLGRQRKMDEISALLAFELRHGTVSVLFIPETGSLEGMEPSTADGPRYVRITERLLWEPVRSRFALLEEPLDYEELSRFRNPGFSSNDNLPVGALEFFTVPAFNALCIDPDALADTVLVGADKQTDELDDTPCIARLDITTQPDGSAVTVCGTDCGGISAAHGSFLIRELHAGEGVTRHSRLMTAKSRRDVVESAFLRCVLARSRKEHDAIVAEVAEHPLLELRLHKKDAKRWLDDAARETAAMERTLLADPAVDSGGWRIASGGIRAAARALLALHELAPWQGVHLRDDSVWTVQTSVQAVFEALPTLVQKGIEHGFTLRVDGRAVEAAALEFEVDARTVDAGAGAEPSVKPADARPPAAEDSQDRIDWFELHPSVRHEGRTLPPEIVAALLQKGYYEDTDGRLRVVDANQRETLARLNTVLLESGGAAQKRMRKTPGEPVRVPRLRMLELLLLSRMGVVTRMPPEEQAVMESLAAFRAIEPMTLPRGLKASLRDYQKAGYDWLAFLYRHRFGACLADDMGLGKTLQTIALLGGIHEGLVTRPGETPGPSLHLVVLPPTLLFNWRREIEQFYPDLPIAEYSGATRDVKSLPDHGVVLTTYELVRRDLAKLVGRQFDAIVFDEAQAVKNLDGRRSRAMRQLRGRFKLCLTGTPLENRISEYHAIVDLAMPGLFDDDKSFARALKENPELILDRVRPFVLRRTKDRILKELPPKLDHDVYLDASEQQKAYYTAAVATVRAEVQSAYRDRPKQQAGIIALTALLRLRQICVSPKLVDTTYADESPKLDHLKDALEELAAEGQAALVFSQFVKALDLAEARLRDAGLRYLRMDGSTPQPKRKGLVGAFQDEAGPPIFLISLKTGGAGLNLTRASHVFHLDPWWNPAVEDQASDRAHRIGQRNRVFIHRLLMNHTVEEKMMVLKKRKRDLFNQIVGGSAEKDAGGLITREDIDFLIG